MTSMSMSRDTRMGLRMVTTLVGISNLPAPHLIYIYIYESSHFLLLLLFCLFFRVCLYVWSFETGVFAD